MTRIRDLIEPDVRDDLEAILADWHGDDVDDAL
jgi:hypothetical protein